MTSDYVKVVSFSSWEGDEARASMKAMRGEFRHTWTDVVRTIHSVSTFCTFFTHFPAPHFFYTVSFFVLSAGVAWHQFKQLQTEFEGPSEGVHGGTTSQLSSPGTIFSFDQQLIHVGEIA